MIFDKYDVIVVGGGHAGCEAAAAAANMGSKTLLITMNMNAMAAMSCNPAVGGIAKGQIVREIDALGGQMGIVADKTMIQFRMLNKSKGPAVWSPRVQSDKFEFAAEWRNVLEKTNNLEFWQDHVDSLIVEGDIIRGVHCQMGGDIYSKTVILTNGTFLNGKIFIGEKSFSGGRISESASYGITEQLVSLGFEADRMKTGTPMRIDGRSIDFSKLSEQKGDDDVTGFSYLEIEKPKQQRSCHIAYTSLEVHDILRKGFEKSPLFTGRIKGIGPRYCPSIEDKIERFADKDFHQLFVEPEGRTTVEYYLNGFSSSLPEDIQYEALRHIEGFENAKIFRPGYAIEYDFFPPNQLYHSLETHHIHGLFFAGQINGTTGYEEAAAQGLMAGINAHRSIHDLEPIVLRRDEAYIGVLIDDLITKSVDEPYRMFTSRAEYRILLRQDNADARLTEKGYEIGLATEERLNHYKNKYERINELVDFLKNTNISPDRINGLLESKGTPGIANKMRLAQILTRPQISLTDMINVIDNLKNEYDLSNESIRNIVEEAEIIVKYEGYIDKEREVADKLNRLENVKLSPDFDYYALNSLTMEAREKLTKHKPQTLGQASRISGISPADISVIAVYLGR
ncbi:MAG: tRNA uridine-5-carboxymethylaminomethyl(34) synthesis enzyme MnmG [Lentimicrobiaceae bacterium]|nr:tRNA uridine-5-carboxymethylaminomethyl(34) synthesis enzyme MnmG [Lentimicrobiaceae bacterium]MBR2051876.1 tRNA uridine-5-carboxymethylaminomethyl(34) synthesis enzyme MnmG [Bacteroidales bacterium]